MGSFPSVVPIRSNSSVSKSAYEQHLLMPTKTRKELGVALSERSRYTRIGMFQRAHISQVATKFRVNGHLWVAFVARHSFGSFFVFVAFVARHSLGSSSADSSSAGVVTKRRPYRPSIGANGDPASVSSSDGDIERFPSLGRANLQSPLEEKQAVMVRLSDCCFAGASHR
jgi:hypothetical protein